MKNNLQKCSLLYHIEKDANLFCQECKIYMCNECEKYHSNIFLNHHQYKLGEYNDTNELNQLFTGLCKEKNHPNELKYFCKTHNKLCCAECITKIKGEDYGQHSDCDVCPIKEIEDEKKSKLNENIKTLENLSFNLKESINELKIIFEKIENNKEELKIKIQNIFTKLRNQINDREDELLLEVDKKFKDLYFNDNILKESEKLPDIIQISLEKGKLINNNKDRILNSIINDCINIENNINEIKTINASIHKFKSIPNKIEFIQNETEIKFLFGRIKNYGRSI